MMKPTLGIGNLIQAGIFGAGAWWLRERWGVSAGIVGLCALAQVVGAGCMFTGRVRWARWCSIACLVAVAVLVGLYWGAGNHLMEAYGSDARKIGENSRAPLLLFHRSTQTPVPKHHPVTMHYSNCLGIFQITSPVGQSDTGGTVSTAS